MMLATEIPWAAIGACLAGAGSFLTGYAALKVARRGDDESSVKGNPPPDE